MLVKKILKSHERIFGGGNVIAKYQKNFTWHPKK